MDFHSEILKKMFENIDVDEYTPIEAYVLQTNISVFKAVGKQTDFKCHGNHLIPCLRNKKTHQVSVLWNCR